MGLYRVQIIIQHFTSAGVKTEGFCTGPRFNNITDATNEMCRVYELSGWDNDPISATPKEKGDGA